MAENEDKYRTGLHTLLKKLEGFGHKGKAYKLEGEEFYTQGYGRYGKNIVEGTTITEDQASKWLYEDIDKRLPLMRAEFPNFEKLSKKLQLDIGASWYRGSFNNSKDKKDKNGKRIKKANGSPTTRRLIKEGKYKKAGAEFLDNAEYRKRKKQLKENIKAWDLKGKKGLKRKKNKPRDSVVERMNATSASLIAQEPLKKEVDFSSNGTTAAMTELSRSPAIQDVQPSEEDARFLQTMTSLSIPDKPKEKFDPYVGFPAEGDRPAPRTFIDSVKDITLEEYGNDFKNTFFNRTVIGQGIKNLERNIWADRSFVDTNFSPFEQFPEVMEEIRRDLSPAIVEDILDTSENQDAFLESVHQAKQKQSREREIQEFTSRHPVFSVSTGIASMVTDAAVFMPVSAVMGAAATGSKGLTLKQFLQQATTKQILVGELAEEVIRESLFFANNAEHTFDPLMFIGGMAVGTGLQKGLQSFKVDKVLRDLVGNEDGFINISTAEGKQLVDVVKKQTTNLQAHQLAEAISAKKTTIGNEIRANLISKRKAVVRQIAKHQLALKSFKKGSKEYDIAKGKLQKSIRHLQKTDKRLPQEIASLVQGTHPKLQGAVNPIFSLKAIAKDLDVDVKHLESNDSLRVFLGLDNVSGSDFVIEGDANYAQVARNNLEEMKDNVRLNMNETLKYIAGTDTVKAIDDVPILGKLQLGDKLNTLASTDGPVSRLLFNKGNLVSSENELVASYYNFLAPDGGGRQGTSKIRAIESQQKYSNMYGSKLTKAYQGNGSDLYDILEGKGFKSKAKSIFTPDDFENKIIPIFDDRLHLGSTAFREKYGDAIGDIGDQFAKDWNKINKDLTDNMKRVGVKNVDYDVIEDHMNRSWDSRKARAIPEKELDDTIYRAMKSHMDSLEIKMDEKELRKAAHNFSYGLRNKDLGSIEDLNSSWIKQMSDLADKADTVGEGSKTIRNNIERLKELKRKADMGDLANRVQMDVEVTLPNGKPLRSLFEDNFVATQKRYVNKMSARIAAAEHGIKDIDDIQEWIDDAVSLEIKRAAARGDKNPVQSAKDIKDSMQQDFMSFKSGAMSGHNDMPDAAVGDMVRLVKKYNYAKLMQYVAISSLAEFGNTVIEAGAGNVLRSFGTTFRDYVHDIMASNPSGFTNVIYNELSAVMGVGLEDFAFSTKGFSAAERITESGIANKLEQGIDVISRVTQGTFGGIETIGRRMTANSLALKWADYFTGREKGGLLSAFFGANGVSNRVLENSNLGKFNKSGEFIFNDNYKSIKANMKKHAKFNSDGNLEQLNLKDWDNNVAQSFGDVIQLQANHIAVNPDATTMALWQSTALGQILNQFRTFTVNAATKVSGQAIFNAAISSNKGDHAEIIKGAQKIFWGTALGMLAVTLRQGIQRAGGDKEIDLYDEGMIKAAAIGFSRSSVAGNLPTLMDTLSGRFGYDPIFEKSSSIGRSKNFFNLATSPTGQAIGGVSKAVDKALSGEMGGAGMQLLKTSPIYRQMIIQQLMNRMEKE